MATSLSSTECFVLQSGNAMFTWLGNSSTYEQQQWAAKVAEFLKVWEHLWTAWTQSIKFLSLFLSPTNQLRTSKTLWSSAFCLVQYLLLNFDISNLTAWCCSEALQGGDREFCFLVCTWWETELYKQKFYSGYYC